MQKGRRGGGAAAREEAPAFMTHLLGGPAPVSELPLEREPLAHPLSVKRNAARRRVCRLLGPQPLHLEVRVEGGRLHE